ncbi:hypothetical protein HG536_0D01530 [Torulaspora globosa]|uniref:TAFII55 protein conserved region domain-containing protein n=1 Tax=Torulaspora globosa TaxID=48254 RepID=A0A7G3ZGJ5_9SACH|nr:uncharacterized protein HG536_0D01530 [Torulaspora globosa]QLL32631.1 hypothetical protein HG536_0D01530 [Torulaspora globosa]
MPVIKIKKRKEESNDEEASRPRKLRIKTKVMDEEESQPEVRRSLKKSTSSGRSRKPNGGSGMKLKLNLKKSKSAEPEKPPKAPRLRVKPIRVPGEGYDSEASDIEDDPLIEEAIVLRVLPDIQAEFVKHSIDSGDYSGISIKWKGQRHAIVNINDVSYGAILVNLPTVIEVNKSVDRKNLLKTVDVSQMLLCIQVIESEEEVFTLRPPETEDLVSKHFEEHQDEINECKMKFFKGYNDGPLTELETKYLEQIATKPYDYKHGLTPPLYNVRNRRFRRKMGLDEFEYAEKCVERLLRQDDQAEEVTYELVDEDEIQRRSTPAASLSQLETRESYAAETADHEKEEVDLNLDEAFQSDTEEAKERGSFKDEAADERNEHDLFDETGDDVEQDNGEEDEEEEEEEEEEENEPEDEEAEDNAERVEKQAVDEDRQHNELLKDELNELETTLNHARQKLQKAANPLLKSRFVETIKKLEREVELKRKQLKFSDETLQKPEDETQPAPSQEQQPETAVAGDTDDDEDEEDEDEEDEDEDDEEEDDEDRAAPDQPQELDQNDLDMMMLFGAEGDDAEE